mgnify:CR=1 FL=1
MEVLKWAVANQCPVPRAHGTVKDALQPQLGAKKCVAILLPSTRSIPDLLLLQVMDGFIAAMGIR